MWKGYNNKVKAMNTYAYALAPTRAGAIDWNVVVICHFLKVARELGVSLLEFQALTLAGTKVYGEECWDLESGCREALREILPHTAGLAAWIGLPLRHGGELYKAFAVVSDGELLCFPLARVLLGSGRNYEGRWFAAPMVNEVFLCEFDGEEVLAGDFDMDHDECTMGWMGWNNDKRSPNSRWRKAVRCRDGFGFRLRSRRKLRRMERQILPAPAIWTHTVSKD